MQQLWQPPMSNLAIYMMGHGPNVFGWDRVTKTYFPSDPKQPENTQSITAVSKVLPKVMKDRTLWDVENKRSKPMIAEFLHFCESLQAVAQRRSPGGAQQLPWVKDSHLRDWEEAGVHRIELYRESTLGLWRRSHLGMPPSRSVKVFE